MSEETKPPCENCKASPTPGWMQIEGHDGEPCPVCNEPKPAEPVITDFEAAYHAEVAGHAVTRQNLANAQVALKKIADTGYPLGLSIHTGA